MNTVTSILAMVLVVFTCGRAEAQEGDSPVKIKVSRIVFKAGNQYSVDIPNFEFHVLLQKSFDRIRSSITADYDYSRKDMGFGMSHSLHNFSLNPGISVGDNLYFREIFNDTTGVWYRNQSITPFLFHELNRNSVIVMEFKFEKEWSPKRRMGTDIISYYDYSVKVHYVYKNDDKDTLKNRFFNLSLERSYKILKGQYNYLLLDVVLKYSDELNARINYKSSIGFHGNITPQNSPLYFLGGKTTLIGYNNDEFWGRRVFYYQNRFDFNPFPEFKFSIKGTEFRHVSLLCQIDIGQVRGASNYKDLKPQPKDLQIGTGLGVGVNTDLPYMPNADIHFIIASPADDVSDIKIYAGFGSWLD